MAKKSRSHSIHDEPAYAPPPSVENASAHDEPALGNIQGAGNDEDIAAQSVWDEVGTQGLGYETPEGALSYANWYASNAQQCSAFKSWCTVLLVAVLSASFALGSVMFNNQTGDSLTWLAMRVSIPFTEEYFKVMGTLILLERFPYFYRSSFQLFLVVMISALSFACMENFFSTPVFIQNASSFDDIVWQWGMGLTLHLLLSISTFFGLQAMWLNSRIAFSKPLLQYAHPYIIGAGIVHVIITAILIVAT